MCNNIYIQNEAKNSFKGWTKEGLDFLLHSECYKNIAIDLCYESACNIRNRGSK